MSNEVRVEVVRSDIWITRRRSNIKEDVALLAAGSSEWARSLADKLELAAWELDRRTSLDAQWINAVRRRDAAIDDMARLAPLMAQRGDPAAPVPPGSGDE